MSGYDDAGKIIYIADYIEPGRRELPNMADEDGLLFRILMNVCTGFKRFTGIPEQQENCGGSYDTKTYDYYKKKWERRIKYGSGKGNGKNRI